MAITDQKVTNRERGSVGGASSIGFANQLTAVKRQARLRGRPVTGTEVRGISEAQAAGASDRLFKGEAVKLQREQLDFQNRQLAAEIHSAERARKGSFCIIISACTSSNSYEVGIAREYRDGYMDGTTLAGYYSVCEKVVPYIKRQRIIKYLFKKFLVDNLIDYFEWFFRLKLKRYRKFSKLVTHQFLGYCRGEGESLTDEEKDKLLEKHR